MTTPHPKQFIAQARQSISQAAMHDQLIKGVYSQCDQLHITGNDRYIMLCQTLLMDRIQLVKMLQDLQAIVKAYSEKKPWWKKLAICGMERGKL